MPIPIDYQRASVLLSDAFSSAQQDLANNAEPPVAPGVAAVCQEVMRSSTQAYREVLLGCLLAKLLHPAIDIRKPYAAQGEDAFNGRTLDERVINRFLRQERIPSSAGPYLSVFRRSVQFVPETRGGLRDKIGYDALLRVLDHVEVSDPAERMQVLRHLLYQFARLREEAVVPLARPGRISLDQFDAMLGGLLTRPSGGRFPLLLVTAALRTLAEVFSLAWQVEFQGINVADAATGAGGDVTVRAGDQVLLAAEVTERVVDQARVVATFQAKVLPGGIRDYLFFAPAGGVSEEARLQARRYFAQGHAVDFVEIQRWIIDLLATMGQPGGDVFARTVIALLDAAEVPTSMRVAWNQEVERLTAL